MHPLRFASVSPLRTLLGSLLGLALLLTVSACGDDATQSSAPAPSDTSASLSTLTDTASIARVLRTDDRFTTLVTALDSARLDSQLASGGPYTLFAPTNAAFERLPDGTIDDLLTDQQDRLREILLYHVADGRHLSASIPASDTLRLPMLGGAALPLSRVDDTLRAGTVDVLTADVETANGVIHVLDGVLRPPEE